MGRFDSLTSLGQLASPATASEPVPVQKSAPDVREQPVPKPERGYPSPSPYSQPSPKALRKIKDRHPFDIYEDQYESLKRIADEERAQGLPGSMNRMVREGIDMYLAARNRKK
jgi:hypothetical protein